MKSQDALTYIARGTILIDKSHYAVNKCLTSTYKKLMSFSYSVGCPEYQENCDPSLSVILIVRWIF